jgi:putative transposase
MKPDRAREKREAELYQQIGQLKVELDWLKKNLTSDLEVKRSWIEDPPAELSFRRQCELAGLARSSFYY